MVDAVRVAAADDEAAGFRGEGRTPAAVSFSSSGVRLRGGRPDIQTEHVTWGRDVQDVQGRYWKDR